MATERKISAADFLPTRLTLQSLRAAAGSCKGCDLYRNASQTVFGEGPQDATLVLVGEQPGDMEDRQGRPFVGPAGRMLDKALVEAGISREQIYLTNAVKHFKWIHRGKRRMHQKPLIRQVISCKPWLQAELAIVHPKAVVCMGATAAQSILGRIVRVTRERGKFFDTDFGVKAFITIHPSAILRERGKSEQEKEYRRFVADINESCACYGQNQLLERHPRETKLFSSPQKFPHSRDSFVNCNKGPVIMLRC